MEFIEKKLKDAYEIKLKPIGDTRGFFMRSYDQKIFQENGFCFNWVQENHSKSTKKGIIRGIHLQLPPFCETKLIRAIKGEVLDIFIDLRKESPSFGQWDSIFLSENKHNYALIPRGFGHAICTLTDECEVIYKVDNFYSQNHEFGIIWNDIDLNIHWPIDNPFLSEKDKNNFTLQQFINRIGGIEL